MKKWIAWISGTTLVFALAGCTPAGGDAYTGNVMTGEYEGIVVDRFTEGGGSDRADCLTVDVGKEGTIVFTIIDRTEIAGADDISVGDTVEITCESYADSAYHPILSVEIKSAGADGADQVLLTAPPALTVACGVSNVEALMGSYHWIMEHDDGTATATIADGMHPLECKEFMQPLHLLPAPLPHIEPLAAYLQFEVTPDTVLVRCWSEEYWGDQDAIGNGEELPVQGSEANLIDGRFAQEIRVDLKDGNYIYEITAEWNHSDQYSGTASYSFYTIAPEQQPVEE